MGRKWVGTALLAGLLLAVSPAAEARGGFRGGGGVRGGPVMVGPMYGGFGYGGFYGPWGGLWGPWGPGYYGGFGVYDSHPNSGQVKFDTKQKDAQVYIGRCASWNREGHEVHVAAAGRLQPGDPRGQWRDLRGQGLCFSGQHAEGAAAVQRRSLSSQNIAVFSRRNVANPSR